MSETASVSVAPVANGSAEEKTPSLIKTIKETFSGKPDAAKLKKAAAEYKTASKARKDHEEALEKAKHAESVACAEMARACGAADIEMDGVLYGFSSRGETVFLREKTKGGVVKI